jgi:hypothetical protein
VRAVAEQDLLAAQAVPARQRVAQVAASGSG